MVALAVGLALAMVACTSGGAPTSTPGSTTSDGRTAATTPVPVDPGPGPTSLEGVTIELEDVVAGGLNSPTAVAARPMRNELWIAERPGRIRIVNIDTEYVPFIGGGNRTGYTLLSGAVLDLTALTTTDGERGLLGLAFSTDGRTLYVDHTSKDGDVVIASYTVADEGAIGSGPNTSGAAASEVASIDPKTRRELVTVGHRDFSNHNGGQLTLGPDGYLYIGVGDGGGAGDPNGNAQDPDTLLGKILRIDPAGATMVSAFGIPSTNPYADGGGKPEIYLIGARNPWRFSFDRANGDLWVGDVGQGTLEEIDWLPSTSGAGAGTNLGWNWFEGGDRFRTTGTPPDGLVEPIFTYDHSGGNCSITGGYVYRGSRVPDLVGTYVYGDYCTGEIRGLLARNGVVLDERALGASIDESSLVSFGEDGMGTLYVVSAGGTLSRVVAG